MTSSPTLFERVAKDHRSIFNREPEVLTSIIAEACRIKADVVTKDEKESGLRRILNFGHTAGHALESVTKYTTSATVKRSATACSSPPNWRWRAAP